MQTVSKMIQAYKWHCQILSLAAQNLFSVFVLLCIRNVMDSGNITLIDKRQSHKQLLKENEVP